MYPKLFFFQSCAAWTVSTNIQPFQLTSQSHGNLVPATTACIPNVHGGTSRWTFSCYKRTVLTSQLRSSLSIKLMWRHCEGCRPTSLSSSASRPEQSFIIPAVTLKPFSPCQLQSCDQPFSPCGIWVLLWVQWSNSLITNASLLEVFCENKKKNHDRAHLWFLWL